jgi:hypothetical protein
MQLPAELAVRNPTALAIVVPAIFKLLSRFPFKLDNPGEIDAVLAQVYEPFRFVPLEFHASTSRM